MISIIFSIPLLWQHFNSNNMYHSAKDRVKKVHQLRECHIYNKILNDRTEQSEQTELIRTTCLPLEKWWIFKYQMKITLGTNFTITMMYSTFKTTRSLSTHLKITKKGKHFINIQFIFKKKMYSSIFAIVHSLIRCYFRKQ